MIAVFTSCIRNPRTKTIQRLTHLWVRDQSQAQPNIPRIFGAGPNLPTVLFFSPFWLMISLRNSHLTVLLFASNLCFPFTSVSSLQLLEGMAVKRLLGMLAVYQSLKFML